MAVLGLWEVNELIKWVANIGPPMQFFSPFHKRAQQSSVALSLGVMLLW